MLKTPSKDPVDIGLKGLLQFLAEDRSAPGEITPGYVQTAHWSPDFDGWRIGKSWNLPEIQAAGIGEFGVCDSIDQFDAVYGDTLRALSGTYAVFFVHVAKDPTNAGQGGGWRWHKWGTYIGEGHITREYLDDEEGFPDGVFTYHIYEVEG